MKKYIICDNEDCNAKIYELDEYYHNGKQEKVFCSAECFHSHYGIKSFLDDYDVRITNHQWLEE